MNHMKNTRVLSFVLALAMVFSIVIPVSAAYTVQGADLKIAVTNPTAVLYGTLNTTTNTYTNTFTNSVSASNDFTFNIDLGGCSQGNHTAPDNLANNLKLFDSTDFTKTPLATYDGTTAGISAVANGSKQGSMDRGTNVAITISKNLLSAGKTYYIYFDANCNYSGHLLGNNIVFVLSVVSDDSFVSSVSIDKTDIIIEGLTKTATLNATISPSTAADKTVTWTSGDTNVLTVDNSGVITPVAAGKTTVTVTTNDGNKTAVANVEIRNNSNNRVLEKISCPTSTPAGINLTSITAGDSVYKDVATGRFVLGYFDPSANDFKAAFNISSGRKASVYYIEVYSDSALSNKIASGVVGDDNTKGNETSDGLTINNSGFARDGVNIRLDSSKCSTSGNYYIVVKSTSSAGATAFAADVVFEFSIKAPAVPVTGVSLNKTSTIIDVGSNETLTATVIPDDAEDSSVTWSSSNESVATVDATGKVTAVAMGTATITAKTTDGEFTATCKVTVPGIKLSYTEKDVFVSTSQFTYPTVTTYPAGQSYTWAVTSGSSSVTVEYKKESWRFNSTSTPGTAVVTASMTYNSKQYKADYTVTVKPNLVTGITLAPTSNEIYVGASTTYTATVAPTNATIKTLSWSSLDESIATVDSTGKVIGVAAGTTTIKATSTDGSNISGSATITVKNKHIENQENIVEIDANGVVATISSEDKEALIADATEQLSEYQAAKEAIDMGYGVKINIEVNEVDVDDLTVGEKAKFEKAAGDTKLGFFFEININAEVNGNEYPLTELSNKITITINLPEEYQGHDKYYVVREHNGEYDLIEATLSADGKSVSFNSDKFSTYALTYADIEKSNETKKDETKSNKTNKEAETVANTYDGTLVFETVAMLTSSASLVFALAKKKREDEE